MANNKDEIKEQILEALDDHPCISSGMIAFYIKRKHGGDLISKATISGMLRPMVMRGEVAKSAATGETVYWIVEDNMIPIR